MRKGWLFFVLMGLTVWLTGCSDESGQTRELISDPLQLNAPGCAIGVPETTTADLVSAELFKKADILHFSSLTEGYHSVISGKLDGFVFDRHSLDYVALVRLELAVMPQVLAPQLIAVGAPKKNAELIKKVNEFIKRYQSDGTYEQMYKRWLSSANGVMPEIPAPTQTRMKLRVGTEGLNVPMNYYGADGKLTGFDIEFVRRLALYLNADIELMPMPYAALLVALESGKLDLLVANLNETPERREKILFSDSYVASDIAMIVRADRMPPKPDVSGISDLTDRPLGVLTGTIYDQCALKSNDRVQIAYYLTFADMIAALRSGKIDGFLADEPVARSLCAESNGIIALPEHLTQDRFAFIIRPDNDELKENVDSCLKKFLADGTVKKLDNIWFESEPMYKVVPPQKSTGRNGTLHVAINTNIQPFTFVRNNEYVGFDIALMKKVADELDMLVEFHDMDCSALLPSVASGKCDLGIGCITVTEERAKSIHFSEPYYYGGVQVVVRDPAYNAQEGDASVWQQLQASFDRTFVREMRYKLVLEGLLVTLIISIASAVIGTILGFGICLMRGSHHPALRAFAACYISLLQGIPVLVFLMILYYIVFGSLNISSILVAVVGFSINFSAYVAEILRSGIDAVDKGQREAAYALGFSRSKAFLRIILPQAIRHSLNVYRGEFISMVKMTSVVGYIAIRDLTKVSDIIRSRTYEAFFPLIATAVLYFLLAYALTSFLTYAEFRIDPKRRPRMIKGVRI